MHDKFMKILKLILPLCWISFSLPSGAVGAFDCPDTATLFAAAHGSNRKILENHLKHRCPIYKKDPRGFILYDVLTLKGDKAIVRRLSEKDAGRNSRYSMQMIRLLQTGLRFLGFDAGIVNGRMTDTTREGIRAYQKSLGVKADGVITPGWVAIFYRRLTRRMQSELDALGFRSGRADGIIGKNTRTAMQAFRRQRKMPEIDYPYIDDQLIYQLMMAKNEAYKREIKERDRKQRAQAPHPPRKKAEKVGLKQSTRRESAVKKSALPAKQAGEKEKNAQKQVKLKHRLDRPIAKHEAAKAKVGQREAIARQKLDQAKSLPQPVVTTTGKQAAPRPNSPIPTRTAGKGFKRLSGTLSYQDKSTMCRIDGQRIDPNWCLTYHRNGNGRHCDAIISDSGIVVSLLCK